MRAPPTTDGVLSCLVNKVVGQFEICGLQKVKLPRHNADMASRDRFEIVLACPQCGNSGKAKVSENDYPFMRHPGFEIDEFPDGMKLEKYANHRKDTKIRCQCGEVFNA